MNVEITDNHFFLVRMDGESHVVDDEDAAIECLQEHDVEVDLDDEGDDDSLKVVRVDFEDDEWTIKELPWKRIAVRLLEER